MGYGPAVETSPAGFFYRPGMGLLGLYW